jgi:hypothetical protein
MPCVIIIHVFSQEAEHLRGTMHGRNFKTFLPSETDSTKNFTCGAMWLLGDDDLTLLHGTKGPYKILI